jgi:protein-tyrosine kinase
MSKVFEALQRLEKSANLSADFAEIHALLNSPAPDQEAFTAPVEEIPEVGDGKELQPSLLPDDLPALEEPRLDTNPPKPRVVPVRISSESPLLPFDQDRAKVGEQYRIIRTKIVHHPMSHRVIAVCSVGAGDGKTVTSINVAAALALKSDTTVLLVEGDLRRGSIASLLGTPATPGLTDVLTGASSLSEAIIQTQQIPNLSILIGGTRLASPGEVLDSPRWQELVQHFRKLYDYVIVDTPPLGLVADCDLIQAVSDGIILVARVDHSARSRCKDALAKIPPERLIGVVLNCVDGSFLRRDQDYYGRQSIQSK